MATETSDGDVPLPKGWPATVTSAVPQVISLAHLPVINSWSGAACNANARFRLQEKLEWCHGPDGVANTYSI